MRSGTFVILSIFCLLALSACGEGFLDVANGSDQSIDDVGDMPDAGPDAGPDEGDTGPDDDIGVPDDADDNSTNQNNSTQNNNSQPEGCVDDQFAPDNFNDTGAASLNPGDSYDLILCDNEIDGVTSHNFFYLGQTTQIDVQLTWDEADGPLGLDFWSAPTDQGGDRTYHADGGTDPSSLSFSQSLDSATHIYARVFFRTDNMPEFGAPYTISRAN